MSTDGLTRAQHKMRDAGIADVAVNVFSHYYEQLRSGASGIIHESDIEPLEHPTRLADLDIDPAAGREALARTVVVKLNGGLGTSMGLEAAKTLLEVRDGLSFLDIIARQVLALRAEHGVGLPLVLMNSFRTQDDTLRALASYDTLAVDGIPLDFLQNREPKLVADDLTPVEHPADPTLEWCPPGHGDLYTALDVSGMLDTLLDHGYHYAFLSNADNLAARVDPRVAGWFAGSGAPFASEVCRRTASDRKGGHLAVRRSDGQLVLRESAQTADDDTPAFGDITRHRFFNTNNLWVDLRALRDTLDRSDGILGLPLIRNGKTVDPSDKSTTKVIQVETAMGAAVEVFEGSVAIEVDRSRFLPIKTTNDLLVLRSDAYDMAGDYAITLAAGLDDAPYVDLDPDVYKLVGDFGTRFPAGPPSMREAASLRVDGDWTFEAGVVVRGDAAVPAEGSPGTITSGTVLGG